MSDLPRKRLIQVPRGLKEKQVQIRYGPATVTGSLFYDTTENNVFGKGKKTLNLSQENCLYGL